MTSPVIRNVLDGVFIHVRDLRRAARWYSALLGLPLKEDELARHYYTLNAPHERPWITLDDHAADPDFEFRPAPHPICSFLTADLEAARTHLRTLGTPWTGEIREVHPGLRAMTVRDPDGNALMLIERT